MPFLASASINFLFLLLMRLQIDKYKEDSSALRSRLDEVMADLKALRATMLRYKITLLRRISDYRKELDFWHDTLRKAVSSGEGARERLLTSITSILRTYTTRERSAGDIEAIEALARELVEKEEL